MNCGELIKKGRLIKKVDFLSSFFWIPLSYHETQSGFHGNPKEFTRREKQDDGGRDGGTERTGWTDWAEFKTKQTEKTPHTSTCQEIITIIKSNHAEESHVAECQLAQCVSLFKKLLWQSLTLFSKATRGHLTQLQKRHSDHKSWNYFFYVLQDRRSDDSKEDSCCCR